MKRFFLRMGAFALILAAISVIGVVCFAYGYYRGSVDTTEQLTHQIDADLSKRR